MRRRADRHGDQVGAHGKVNLKDGYAKFERGELWLMNVHISPYEKASWYQHDPRQNRKLLLHKSELRRLGARVKEKGFTLVPLSMYLKEGRIAKVALASRRQKRARPPRRDHRTRRQARHRTGAAQPRQRVLADRLSSAVPRSLGAIRFDWYGGSLRAGRATGVTCHKKETTTTTHWLLNQATARTTESARKVVRVNHCERRMVPERREATAVLSVTVPLLRSKEID